MNELNELYHYVVNDGKAPTIKQTIEAYINSLEPGWHLYALTLHQELFRRRVAKNSVTRALGQLAKEGKVEKVNSTGGRNSEWKVL